MEKQEICLLNDSFPPLIDGVANTVVNYAKHLPSHGFDVSVVTPSYPDADDSKFPYPVIRYPSIDLRKQIGYTAGNPFVLQTVKNLQHRNISLIHSHCPAASNYLARGLREALDVPMIMTYHTKFDIDIHNAIHNKALAESVIKALVENVSAVDELWVVSKGAGENIRSLGYTGDYVVMENGVDIPRMRATEEEVYAATQGYDLPENTPVFLFVGRLMWYKGLRIILDALAAMKYQKIPFRMIMIGGGGEEQEVREYAKELGLDDCVIFTGPIRDRKVLSAWYTRADLFLFPSSFDTNGLVVREAAACSLGTVMIDGSCASEGVTNGVNGLFIQENALSLAVCLTKICANRDLMRRIGENASRDLYFSWQDAVSKAVDRYYIVMDNYRSGKKKRERRDLADEMFALREEFLQTFEKIDQYRRSLEDLDLPF